jgi:uncharacterized protein (TIGR04551 family)
MKRALLLAAVAALLVPGAALATGFTDFGNDLRQSQPTLVQLDGALRLRLARLYNLDLDRGPTPSGELFAPTSLSDPSAQSLYSSDLRLRTDIALYAPGGIVGVKARIDVLDNLPIGGSADGIPGGTVTQEPPSARAFRIKRAYGEVVLPIGYFAAGRVGHHWGLGMLGNGGDCLDCDSGDAADRVAFVTPLVSHLFAFAYDFSSTGYLVKAKDENRSFEVEPTAAVRSLAVAVLNWRSPEALKRRRQAEKATFEYGLFYAHRWQDDDIPATYLPVASPVAVDAAQVQRRGLSAHAVDFWARLTLSWLRVEIEAAYLRARIEQSSLLTGFELPGEVESEQYGAVIESTIGPPEGFLTGGIDLGYASGDDAPGFGARPPLQTLHPPKQGDLDGPQGMPPNDLRVDNFRFHPDYRVDRILFREIIGTVTDAFYVRPHLRLRVADLGAARFEALVAAVASWANEAASTPGGKRPLGLEIDPTLRYVRDDGFAASLEYAVLFPWSGLDNVGLGLRAEPAQLLRLTLAYGF